MSRLEIFGRFFSDKMLDSGSFVTRVAIFLLGLKKSGPVGVFYFDSESPTLPRLEQVVLRHVRPLAGHGVVGVVGGELEGVVTARSVSESKKFELYVSNSKCGLLMGLGDWDL
jgi:hypothetical protein